MKDGLMAHKFSLQHSHTAIPDYRTYTIISSYPLVGNQELPNDKVTILCLRLEHDFHTPILHRFPLFGGPVHIALLLSFFNGVAQHHNRVRLKLHYHTPEILHGVFHHSLSHDVAVAMLVALGAWQGEKGLS